MCVSSMIGAGGAIFQGYQAIKTGDAEQNAAERNAMLASEQASDAYRRGEVEAAAVRYQGNKVTQRALTATAANGLDSSVGSPAGVIASSSANTALDESRVRANAAREAWGYKIEEQNQLGASRRARHQAMLGTVGAGLGLAGSFLSFGASSVGAGK